MEEDESGIPTVDEYLKGADMRKFLMQNHLKKQVKRIVYLIGKELNKSLEHIE